MTVGIDLLAFEKQMWSNDITLIAGIDEAGRGPLAGPVVAAAVMLHKDKMIEAITQSARTGKIGAGKIFVTDVDEVYTVRTGRKEE